MGASIAPARHLSSLLKPPQERQLVESGTHLNGDRLPDSITPVSTAADCQQVIQARGGYGFFDAYWQERAPAHDSLVYDFKQMPKTHSFLRAVLDENMKGTATATSTTARTWPRSRRDRGQLCCPRGREVGQGQVEGVR
jgi:hypothetical protein